MKKTEPTGMCSGNIRRSGSYYMFDSKKPCKKKASVVDPDDGKDYCKTHAPSLRREQAAAKSKARSEEWARVAKVARLKDAIVKADKAIVDQALKHLADDSMDTVIIYVPIAQKAADAREALKKFEASFSKKDA